MKMSMAERQKQITQEFFQMWIYFWDFWNSKQNRNYEMKTRNQDHDEEIITKVKN